jgi:catechol 2,3-dioxygenase-like lactoylglutathione lyase family enzyme
MKDEASRLHNLNPAPGLRDARTDNRFGLRRMDHFAMETNNIEIMERFMIEVLGGEPYYYAGFDARDRDLGRVKHIFIRIGSVLMQCAESKDGKTTLDKNNGNVSPHWAFEVSAEDLDKNIARLRSLGIPVIGPVSHRDIDVTSAYFQSPEGHKLEICTWDPYPVEKTTPGRIDFPSLAHDWPNVKTV